MNIICYIPGREAFSKKFLLLVKFSAYDSSVITGLNESGENTTQGYMLNVYICLSLYFLSFLLSYYL